jgi:hypothetical protein
MYQGPRGRLWSERGSGHGGRRPGRPLRRRSSHAGAPRAKTARDWKRGPAGKPPKTDIQLDLARCCLQRPAHRIGGEIPSPERSCSHEINTDVFKGVHIPDLRFRDKTVDPLGLGESLGKRILAPMSEEARQKYRSAERYCLQGKDPGLVER